MSARHKLNQAFLNEALFYAALLGVITESWAVALVLLAIITAAGIHSGDIRPDKRKRR